MSEQPPSAPDQPEAPPPAYPIAPPTPSAYPAAAPAAQWQPSGPGPGLAYAGFGWRFLGYVLDSIVLFVIETPVTIPAVFVPLVRFYQDHPPVAGKATAALPADLANRFALLGLLGAVVTALYYGGLVAWQGRTLGQRAMGLSVVRAEDGGRLSTGRAYLRAVIFWGPGILGPIPALGSIAGLIALIGLLSAAWDKRKQGWHDKLARSLVVRRVPQ